MPVFEFRCKKCQAVTEVLCSGASDAATLDMVSLSDAQLANVMQTARVVPVEKRDVYLQRIAAMLALRGRFTDADVADVARLALTGLAHQPAA